MPDKEPIQTQNLVVALRVRPINAVELEGMGCLEIIHALDENLVVLQDPNDDQDDILRVNRSREKQYYFDHAFGPNSTQMDVFAKTTKPLIENVVTGYNATVFAYGATGAGKTYTMLGTDKEIGIMGLTLNHLFYEMNKVKEDMVYKVTMSYLELYNEMIRDLLNPTSGILELREDAKGVNVTGISEVKARTTSEVMDMLRMGNKLRTSEPTAANKTSSRSHAILQVMVKQESRVKNIMQEVRVGKLFMIDLAGSERAAQTKNRGKRMIEGAHINRSLLALGNCINALSENRGHYINYRDSKLTRLLKDSLGGNCRTVMIAHVSPASRGFEESRNTLLYADRAKNIKTKVKRNQFSVSYHIAQYTNIIADLRKEIFRLKTKIAEQDVSQEPTRARVEKNSKQKDKDHGEMNKLRNELVSTFREQMEIRHNLMDLEDTAMQIALDTNRYMLVIDEWDQEKVRSAAGKAFLIKEKTERKTLQSGRTTSSESSVDSSNFDKNSKVVWNDDGDSLEAKKVTLSKAASLEDVESKDLDTEKGKKDERLNAEDADSLVEPEELIFAREEINNLIAEEKKVSELKADLQNKLLQTRKEVERLEELLPKKISSEENREILGLICKVHELEITNAELQSQSLLRENLFRYKDLEVSKYKSRQRLCDEIIRIQREVINGAQVNRPNELEALYDVYLQQSSESDDRESLGSVIGGTQSSLSGSGVSLNRAAVLAGINRRMISRENIFTFNSKLSPLTEETPSRLVSLQNSPVKMLRTAFVDNAITEVSSPPPLSSPKRRSHTSSSDTVHFNSPTPPTKYNGPNLPTTYDKPTQLKTHKRPANDDPHEDSSRPQTPMFSKTRKIAELAARRRNIIDQGVTSSRWSLRTNDDALPSQSSSLVSVREATASTSDTNMATVNQKASNSTTAVKASLSLGDLSIVDKKSVDEGSLDSVPVARRKHVNKTDHEKRFTPTRPTKRLRSASLDESKVFRKVKPRRTRKEELQEAARNRTGPYQVSSRVSDRGTLGLEGRSPAARRNKKSHIPKPPPVQATEVPRGPGRGRKSVKQQNMNHSEQIDGELLSFMTNVTPPSTVHQYGTQGKGLTIQKRYRVPSDITGTDSNQSTPRLKPRRPQPHSTNKSIDGLSVSGVAVRPSKQFAGVRRF